MYAKTLSDLLKKHFTFMCFLSMCLLLPALSYAQTFTGTPLNDTQSGKLFTPSSSDQSMIYLSELFGSVPPILSGTGSSIMGQLFKILNTVALTLGTIIAGYTTFVGIMNTAGEGEMLGKNWNSIWVPMRTVAGVALLVPTASGYCICQIFMMWLVVQGVGAADSLTNKVVDYLYSGQKIYVAGDTEQSDGDQKYSDYDIMVTNIFQGLSCMQAYQKEFPDVNPQFISLPTPTMTRDSNNNPTSLVYTFNANADSPSTDPITGVVTHNPVTRTCGSIVVNGINSKNFQQIEDGYAAIMPSLNAAAYYMVNSTAGSTTNSNGTASDPVEDAVMQDTFEFVGADFLSEVEKTYQSYVTQANNQALDNPDPDNPTNSNAGEDTGDGNQAYDDVKAYGWASLGSIYWNIAKSSGDSGATGFNNGWSTDSQYAPYIGASANPDKYYDQTVWKYASGDSAPDGWATQFMNDLIKTRKDGGSNSNSLHKDFDSGKFSATGVVAALSLDVLESMTNHFQKNKNPMVAAQELGHHITYSIEVVFTTLQALMGATGLGLMAMGFSGALGSFFTAPSTLAIMTGIIAALALIFTTVFPGLFAFMAAMLTLGGTLAVVIPFIPVLAYSLAVIAWLIATLETIVAAPIVAIGVLHPDGQHPVLGKAEPAIMLMVNMFLRPGLIVLGFIAGIILSWISIQFINFGFETAVVNLLSNNSATQYAGISDGHHTVSGIEAMLFVTTYVGLIMACVNKSFSVIEAIPNSLMRWIGHDARFEAGNDAMQKIQGSQESAAQKSADTASHSADASTREPEKGAQAGKQAYKDRLETSEDDKKLKSLREAGGGK